MYVVITKEKERMREKKQAERESLGRREKVNGANVVDYVDMKQDLRVGDM